ncbi:MAG TPA: hypothetical protein VKT80_04540, partial [Chloroflexota bacterium]|nr:hypothetical protein [Chloroflexota bacterium]
LAVSKSNRAAEAQKLLLALARSVDGALEWGDDNQIEPLPVAGGGNGAAVANVGKIIQPIRPTTAIVEATAYAALALLELNDPTHARQALHALVLRRNGSGGFGSTQDTVVALQALAAAATKERANANATVNLRSGSWAKTASVTADNADVTQEFDLPAEAALDVDVAGQGTVVVQVARRYNMPVGLREPTDPFKIDVAYGSTHLQVDDVLDITATVSFTPPSPPVPVPLAGATPVPDGQDPTTSILPPIRAGMVVADIAVPTGFALLPDTMRAAASQDQRIKRWDQADRKVIVYITDLAPGETLTFRFGAKAKYPVRAQPVVSQVYSYYRPDWRAEDAGQAVVVAAAVA